MRITKDQTEAGRMRTIYVEKNLPKMLLTKTLTPIWPGVVWSPLSAATVADLPQPALPGPRWLRVRNLQCGICATDLTLLFVEVDPSVAPAALPGNQRLYLGHEVVSVVEAVGAGVTRVKPGDRVVMDTRFQGRHCLMQEIDPPCRHCADGNYGLCENASLGRGGFGQGGGWGDGYTAHETEVFRVPQALTLDQATLIEPMSVALHAVLRRPPQTGERVLILGSGIIGLLTLQAVRAVAPDCHVTAVARYPHQAEAARRLGATVVIGRADYPGVAQLTGGKFYAAPMNKGMVLGGFDLVYDCVGAGRTLEDCLRWARAGGTVVLVGIKFTPLKLDLSPTWYQEVDLIGALAHGVDEWQGQRRPTYEWVVEWLLAGRLTDAGLITHRFPFERYREAVATSMAKGSRRPIKVVFDYQPPS
ncbi:MAG: zinc-binding dehydrogenase [Anaerolineales bacterium]|nr:zinc-binding dehydrogenase [Anaerolineales bacterium]